MSEKEQTIDWHSIIQSILDGHLSFMSGKVIQEADRERSKFVEIDYYCVAEGEAKADEQKKICLPFDHLKHRNIIEFKSIHEVLNEETFRQYVGRALVMENPDKKTSYQREMTLTILTTRKPEALIGKKDYRIERVNDWKYVSRWIVDLDIVILVQKGMRGKKGGEALALLQVLEGEKEKQLECWQDILSQDLSNVETIKKIIQQLSREGYMNLVMELKKEGKIEGKIEEILEVLGWTAPEIVKKYEEDIRAAKTIADLESVKKRIKAEIDGIRK